MKLYFRLGLPLHMTKESELHELNSLAIKLNLSYDGKNYKEYYDDKKYDGNGKPYYLITTLIKLKEALGTFKKL